MFDIKCGIIGVAYRFLMFSHSRFHMFHKITTTFTTRQHTSRGSSNSYTTILGSEIINTISWEDPVDLVQVGQGGQAEEAAHHKGQQQLLHNHPWIETINTISCEDPVDRAQVGQGGQREEAALPCFGPATDDLNMRVEFTQGT